MDNQQKEENFWEGLKGHYAAKDGAVRILKAHDEEQRLRRQARWLTALLLLLLVALGSPLVTLVIGASVPLP